MTLLKIPRLTSGKRGQIAGAMDYSEDCDGVRTGEIHNSIAPAQNLAKILPIEFRDNTTDVG